MREVNADNAEEYLRSTGRIDARTPVQVRELGGGVSNVVLRIDVEGRPPVVVKQSREQLRTKADWFSRLDRIWVERDAMALLSSLLPVGTVPSILFEDRDNYLFAMTCAPDDSVVWKAQLLAGQADPGVARLAGSTLGTIHASTVRHPALASQFADTQIFDQLRIDPFYRRVALVHVDLAPGLAALIDSMAHVAEPTFVHADFSPKNILVHRQGLTLVDFETGHAGDPAFDLGFFLSHLVLKAFRAGRDAAQYFALTRAAWDGYHTHVPYDSGLIGRSIAHTAACALSRIDGKSPVDYRSELNADAVRRFARAVILHPLSDWESMLEVAARELPSFDQPGGNSLPAN